MENPFDPTAHTQMGDGLLGNNPAATMMSNPTYDPSTFSVATEALNSPIRNVTNAAEYSIGSISTNRRAWRSGGPGAP